MDFLKNLWGGVQSTAQYVAGFGTRNQPGQENNLYNSLNGPPQGSSLNVNQALNSGGLVPTANAQTAAPTLTPIGTPATAAAQQQTDLSKYFPNFNADITALNGGNPVTSISSQPFTMNSNGPFNSSSANGNTSINDAMNQRDQMHADMINGSNNDLIPSDNNYSSIINKIYEASLYTPQEQDALGQYNQVQGQILSTQLAARRQIKDLQERGQITKEQGASFLSEAQRRSDAQLADLATQQAGNTLSLQTLGMLRQNQLGALQNIAGLMKPTEVSPGSTLVNPVTGQPTYQGNGAAPATILQSAMSLWTQAQQSGTATYNPDGTPDLQPFLKQAQQYYGGGGLGTYGGNIAGQQAPQNMGGSSSGATPAGYGQNGYGNINMIPPQLQYAVRTDNIGDQGIQYMNASQIPTALLSSAYQNGGKAGIPVLDQAGVGALNAAQQILGIVDAAKALSIRNLKSGVGGRISNTLTNWANNYLQFNPDLSNFDQLRDAASKATTALAGGNGSGFRMNSGIIEAAVNNLPRASDNLETALTRADALATQIINGLRPVFPQVSSDKYGNLLQSQYGNNTSSTNNPFSSSSFYGN